MDAQNGAPPSDILASLPCLSAVQAVDDVPLMGCVESPGAHCGLFEASLTGPHFPEARTLLIGAPACLMHARMTLLPRTRGPARQHDNLLLLPVDQTDAVFGLEEKLVEAILEADRRFQPAMLFLVSTCIPEMIGTDLEAVVRLTQDRVNARLLPVRTDGFSGKHEQLGSRRLLAALARTMEPQPVRARSVNVLGLRGSGGRETELVRRLEAWGATVITVLPSDTGLAEIRRAPAASLNLVTSEIGLDLAKAMQERFGTPWLAVGQPLHPDLVLETYTAMAAALDVPVCSTVRDLAAQARQALSRSARRLHGMRAAVSAFTGGAPGAALFLADLGVEPAVLFLTRLSQTDQAARERLRDRGIDPPVVRTRSSLDQAEVLEAVRPQIFAGHVDPGPLARLGIARVHPDPPRALWGFELTDWAMELVTHAAGEQDPAGREGRP